MKVVRALRRRQRPRDERGFVIVYFAMCLTILMISAAFVVDLGGWYVKQKQLQKAADAAALAGVSFMPANFAQAQSEAIIAAAKNGADPLTNPDITVSVTSDPDYDGRLDVTIKQRNVPRYFSQTFMSGSQTLTARAVGEYLPQ